MFLYMCELIHAYKQHPIEKYRKSPKEHIQNVGFVFERRDPYQLQKSRGNSYETFKHINKLTGVLTNE